VRLFSRVSTFSKVAELLPFMGRNLGIFRLVVPTLKLLSIEKEEVLGNGIHGFGGRGEYRGRGLDGIRGGPKLAPAAV
jgi:hypothetical protein